AGRHSEGLATRDLLARRQVLPLPGCAARAQPLSEAPPTRARRGREPRDVRAGRKARVPDLHPPPDGYPGAAGSLEAIRGSAPRRRLRGPERRDPPDRGLRRGYRREGAPRARGEHDARPAPGVGRPAPRRRSGSVRATQAHLRGPLRRGARPRRLRDAVAERILEYRETLGITGISLDVNPGGQIPYDRVVHSIRLLTDKVMPKFR